MPRIRPEVCFPAVTPLVLWCTLIRQVADGRPQSQPVNQAIDAEISRGKDCFTLKSEAEIVAEA